MRLTSTIYENKIASQLLLTNHLICTQGLNNMLLRYHHSLKFAVPKTHIYLRVFQDTSRFWSKEDFPLVEDNHVRDYLNKLDIHTGPDGMHPQVRRVLANVIARTLNYLWKVMATGAGN